MCDRRELDKIREQRDDAIEREQALLGSLTEMTTERDALAEIVADLTEELADTMAEAERLRAHSVTLNAIGWRMAEALGDVGPDDTEVVSDPEGRLSRLLARLAAQA